MTSLDAAGAAASRTTGDGLAKDRRRSIIEAQLRTWRQRLAIGTHSLDAADGRRQIGEWAVDPSLDELSSSHRTVKLEPKATSVLVYLADRPGQVVSREALMAAVWPGVIVGDDCLTQVVIKLRKALGDVPKAPAYIQTVSKRGYRLIAPVSHPRSPAAMPAQAGVTPVVRAGARRRRWLSASALTLLVVAIAVFWTVGDRTVMTAGALDTSRTAPPTIAIRPFQAVGNDPQALVLAQGITADLTTDLSKILAVTVIDATSAAHSTDTGRSDGVRARYIVSGSVQRAGEQLRLHVHLTDVDAGTQLWSERYERPVSALFAIQQELGPTILQLLPAKVSEADLRRVAQRYTQSLDAYDAFQRGQSALLVRRKTDNDDARELFRRAIAIDPTFARAYAGLALTYAAEFRNQWSDKPDATLDRAFELARTAHQIDPDIPETNWVLAFVHIERRNHDAALRYLRTAVQRNPSFADGYALMGGVLTYVGQPADTVPLLRTAMRLNPDGGYLYFLLLGRAYLFLGDVEQARLNLDEALARNPVNVEAHVYSAALHSIVGDEARAAWEIEEIRTLSPGFSIGRWLQTYPMTSIAQQRVLLLALAGGADRSDSVASRQRR
jgi:DNA-binding winged helix-turn-helix (wHTH) protein/TolB-like protein/Tfp pilus assembly protein PilF